MTGEIVKKSKAEETFASAMDCSEIKLVETFILLRQKKILQILRRIQDT